MLPAGYPASFDGKKQEALYLVMKAAMTYKPLQKHARLLKN